MIRLPVELPNQLSLTEVTFVPCIWTLSISMIRPLPSSIVCIETLYWFSRILTIYLVNSGPYSFTYPEYLSLAMAKVWAGKADLPSTTELWRRYDKTVKDRGGYRKSFQFLGTKQMKGKKIRSHSSFLKFDIFPSFAAAVRFLRGWLNADAVKYGGRQVSSIYIFKCFLTKLTCLIITFKIDGVPECVSSLYIYSHLLSLIMVWSLPLAPMRLKLSGWKHNSLTLTAQHPETVQNPGCRMPSLVITGSSDCYSIDYYVFSCHSSMHFQQSNP